MLTTKRVRSAVKERTALVLARGYEHPLSPGKQQPYLDGMGVQEIRGISCLLRAGHDGFRR